jgi:hypothetical protein
MALLGATIGGLSAFTIAGFWIAIGIVDVCA